MKKFGLLFFSLLLVANLTIAQTPQTLPFSQNWTNTGLITVNDDWSGVPGIIGYRGDDITTSTGVDPQTLLNADDPGVIDVIANQTNPSTNTSGGIAEFEITDPVIALQGSGTADAPYIRIGINTSGKQNIQVSYSIRDIDGSTDNAIQQVALQYRIGNSGNFTNVSAGFVADATTGPSLATLVTPVSVVLPAAVDNQSVVQIRIMTTNAVGNDEWVGIDDISINGTDIVVNTPPVIGSPIASSITINSSQLASNITADGGAPVTARGFVYSVTVTNSDPIIGGTGVTNVASGSGTGSFNEVISSLSEFTQYTFKGYATNSVGTSYTSATNFTTLKNEPSNNVTGFAASLGTPSHSAIDLVWTDASSGTTPDGYLIKANNVGYGSIADPVDGTPETDDVLIKNIAQGLEAATFNGLNANTAYYFKIYPYSNNGSNINYKTDGVSQDDISTNAAPTLPNLLFSEYVEGSSNNKALEIINLSGNTVDLTADNYVVIFYFNGSTSGGTPISLSGTITDGDVFVLVYSSADASLLAYADQTPGGSWFNGDDAIELRKGGASGDILDVIGQVGFDPGSAWGTEPITTVNHTLRRKGTVTIGDRNGANAFDPSVEWDGFATDTFSGLGDPSPLPVELTSFSASVVRNTVKLNWKTETEVNNYGFEVERYALNAERQAWEKIGFVNGNGNSNSPKSYSYEDKNVTAGKYSYRLKQIDNDGQFEYSKAIEVDFGAPKKFELSQNYPNPFNPETAIRFTLPVASSVKLTVFNLLGQEVKLLVNEYKEAGTHIINFNASDFNSGVYIYRLETNGVTQTRKMTLVK